MAMGAKIDRRTLLAGAGAGAGAGAAALAPAAVPAHAAEEGMAFDVSAALARFRSSIPSNFDRDYVEKALSRCSGLAAFSVAG
jgi:hypothetical protein